MKTLNDILLGLRRLSNNLAFTITSILVIVLGLALYLSSYSLSYNFSKPLSYAAGDRYVTVSTYYNDSEVYHFGSNFDGFAFNRLREQVTSFEEFGTYRFIKLSISDGELPRQYVGAEVLPSLLRKPGVEPILGRMFQDEDALPDSQPVAIIGHNIWQNYYSADPDIIGKTSRINGQAYTVVGVMPESFDYPFSQHIWLPLDTSRAVQPEGLHSLGVLGVLKEGVSRESAGAEMDALLEQLVADYPAYYSESRSIVLPHTQTFVSTGDVGQLFQAVTLIILLLATLNLGTLLFVRANNRQQELAIRFAIGASQWEISRQILLESLILCVIGLLLSLGIAEFALGYIEERLRINMLSSDFPGTMSSWIDFSMDARAIGIATSLTLLVWLASGGFAAYKATRKDNNSVLAGGSKGGTEKNRVVMARVIVGFEVLASTFLLIVCCLLTASIIAAYRMDFGTPTDDYYTGMFELWDPRYEDEGERRRFLETLQRQLTEQGVVVDATVGSALPGQGGFLRRYNIADRDLSQDQQYPEQTLIWIANNYFQMLEVPLVEGRYFEETDNADSLPVIIVNRAFAQTHWPGESALGKQVQLDPDNGGVWHTVVGVSAHIIHGSPLGNYDNNPTLYRPLGQYAPVVLSLAVKLNRPLTEVEAEALLLEAAQDIDRDLAITSIRPLQRVTEMSMQGMDMVAQYSVAFALGTFILAIIGVYGNISRSVTQRTNEVGIRRALGSSNRHILWVFQREAMHYLLWGAAVGGMLAVAVSGSLAGFFNDILSFVPTVVPSVLLLIGVLVTLASYLPARRALTIEPGEALHYE